MLTTIATFIAAGAAVLAAGAAVFNVILTARLNRSAALESWRRDRAYPLVLAVQAASQSHATGVNILEWTSGTMVLRRRRHSISSRPTSGQRTRRSTVRSPSLRSLRQRCLQRQ